MNTPDECCDGADSSGYMKVLIQIAISRVGGRPDPDRAVYAGLPTDLSEIFDAREVFFARDRIPACP